MRLPVDTTAVHFVTAGPAEPALNFDTKAQKTTENGEPVFKVNLFCVTTGGPELITVAVTGEPKGIGQFTPVRVTELVANTWTMGDRSGVSFKAARIEAAGTPKAQS